MDENDFIAGQQPAHTEAVTLLSKHAPAPIPDHQLLRCIGRGSYGDVWLARNMMGAYRAVKIVYRKSFEHQRPYERELSGIRKFEPISRSYEGFMDVLHVGINEEQGYFYYVMELGDDQIAGQTINPASYSPKTLAKELSIRGKLDLQECLQLGLALSQALEELHKHGLVHRDVKPSNIIFVNGVPKLADIGLVADVSEARSYVGTEGFIPPEGPGTPQADIYGLGKVLYESCTGKDRQDFPELPTLLDQQPERDGFLELNEVILHACKNNASDRYRSAWDMHAHLLVLTNGKSVKRLKTLERRLVSLKRIASISAVTLVIVTAAFYQVYREWRIRWESRQQQAGANIAYGNRAMESGDFSGALPYFAEALRLHERTSKQESTTSRLRFASVLTLSPKLIRIWFEGRRVDAAEFSPDGKKVLIAQYYGRAKIYDLQNPELDSGPFGPESGLVRAAFSPDGRFVVTASEANSAVVWNVTNLEQILFLPHPGPVLCARFSRDGLRLVTACQDGVARIWNLSAGETNRVTLSLKHTHPVLFANFSNDGKLIVTTSDDNMARIWDAGDGHLIGQPLTHENWVTYADFSPDNQRLVTASLDRKACVWEVATGKRIPPDLKHDDGVESAEFSPDGRLIVTASLDGTARLWSANTLQPLGFNHVLRHGERLTRASFSSDGHRILTTCSDGTVRIWDLAGVEVPPSPVTQSFSRDGSRFLEVLTNGIQVRDVISTKPVSPLIPIESPVEKAELNGKGTFALTVSIWQSGTNVPEQLLRVWEVATGNEVGTGFSLSNSNTRFRLSNDGKYLVTFDSNSSWVWETHTHTVRSLAKSSDNAIGSVYLSQDGHRIAASIGSEVHVWDAASGQILYPPLRHAVPVGHVEFSPDGTRLLTCCWDGQPTKCYAQVWNAATGQAAGLQLQHNDGVLFASFSPDGRRVVTAGEDFRAVVWDAVTGKQLAPSLQHAEIVRTANFSLDGKWIVTATMDGTARVWDAETGYPLTPPLHHLNQLMNARFLADGRNILTADKQGRTRIWNLPVDDRPVEDLILLAALLSGNSVAPAGRLTLPQSESLKSIWQQLRTKYPSTFTTTVEEIAAWHEFQADECEAKREWQAEAFHLRQLQVIHPGDESLAERLWRAEEELRSLPSAHP